MIPNNFTALLQPWLIREDHLSLMATTLQERSSTKDKKSFKLEDYCNVRQPYFLDANGIAHISVFGPTMNNPDPWIKRWYPVTDYKDIQDDINQAIDEGARGALYLIDSPGGTVSGIPETILEMKKLRALMPTATHVDKGAYSAGYYLSTESDMIFSSPSADVGNIGSIIRFYDDSEFLKKIGIERKAIANEGADLKTMFFPLPLTPEQENFLQDSINESGQDFHDQVKSSRPGIDDEVFRAGWYSGKTAIKLGLSDHLGSAQDAYDTLLGEVERRK